MDESHAWRAGANIRAILAKRGRAGLDDSDAPLVFEKGWKYSESQRRVAIKCAYLWIYVSIFCHIEIIYLFMNLFILIFLVISTLICM